MDHEITFQTITNTEHPARKGLVALYQAAFSELPYWESYSTSDVVDNVWLPHITNQCCVIVALRNEEVVGLGCAHDARSDMCTVGQFLEETQSNNIQLPFPFDKTVYMSELAVSAKARKSGIGTTLVKLRKQWAQNNGFTHYCMRTAAQGSNSRQLYEALGAKIASFTQDVRNEGVGSQSDSRIIMYGEL